MNYEENKKIAFDLHQDLVIINYRHFNGTNNPFKDDLSIFSQDYFKEPLFQIIMCL